MSGRGGWFKTPYLLARDPRVVMAGPEAGMVLMAAWAYVHEHNTDGIIPAPMARMLFPVADPNSAVQALIDAGLWKEVAGGFELDGYLDWNPSKQAREAKREAQSKGGSKGSSKRGSSKATSQLDAQLDSSPRSTGVCARALSEVEVELEREEEDQSIEPPATGTSEPEFQLDGSAPKPKRKSKKATAKADPLKAAKRSFRHDWLKRAATETEGEDPERPESELRKRFRWGAAEEKLLDSLAKSLGIDELRTRAKRWWSRDHWVWSKSTGTPSFRQFAQHIGELVPLRAPAVGQGATQTDHEWYRSRRLPEPSTALLWILEAAKVPHPSLPILEQHQELTERLHLLAGEDHDSTPARSVALQFLDKVRDATEWDVNKTIKPQIESAYVAACRESVKATA